VLLLALVDANYKFLYVNVGASGRAGDAGVFGDCSLRKAIDNDQLNLPPPENIDGVRIRVCYNIVADDAFPLKTTIMKPYPHQKLNKSKRIFNYRLSRARRVVENAFGILANRFRVFLTTINLEPEKVDNIILVTCSIHNFLVEHNKHNYISCQDIEQTENQQLIPGQWRRDSQLSRMQTTSIRNSSKSAKKQHKELTKYFVSEYGSVPWQEFMCNL
jgi:hypothetical protein